MNSRMKDNEFGVLKLSGEAALVGFEVRRTIFCLDNDVQFFKSMLLPDTDIKIVTHCWMLPKTVAISGDLELKCVECAVGWNNDDFINNTLTVTPKYIID